MSDDNADEVNEWALAYPFTVCQSQGGPYDDGAFVAGFQAGRVDLALASLAAVGGDRATFTVRTALVPQLQLIGMYHGFSDIASIEVEACPDGSYPAMPEWSTITFRRPAERL